VSRHDLQNKLRGSALNALSIAALAAVIAGGGRLLGQAFSILQPLLIPLALAGILTYLLDPVVCWLERRSLNRTLAVVIVFLVFLIAVLGIIVWVAPTLWRQLNVLIENFPGYLSKAQELVNSGITNLQRFSEWDPFQTEDTPDGSTNGLAAYSERAIGDALGAIQNQIPAAAAATGRFVGNSIGGVLGVFGTIISLVLVPVFLFFFLREAPSIAKGWSTYLPVRSSPFKTELVSVLSEINSYLINFFRGQLLVSMIDGAITAVLLMLIGLDFAILIGLMVAFLGLIPYLGVTISWIPAVIISAAQFGDWLHPLLVTLIFLGVNNLDGIFIAPKIVGDSVGLHPLTIIISVIGWSLILGGLIGALLAVPLTATIKVLMRRYFWDPRPQSEPSPPTSATPG